MQPVGMIVSSHGREVEILVTDEGVELGSILKIGDFYGIVAEMYYQEDENIGSKHRLIAKTQVFGRLEGGKLRKVKKPVRPYTKVEAAGREELEAILSTKDRISIGAVLGTDARAYMNASEYDRHIAILASTGSGKSYAAANLIKEFARLGLPAIVVDTHGEYQKLFAAVTRGTDIKVELYTVKHKRQGCQQLKIPVSNLNANDYMHFTSLNDNQVGALEVILSRIFSQRKPDDEDYSLQDIIAECDRMIDAIVKGKSSDIHEETAKALRRRISGLDMVFRDVFDVYGTDINKLVAPGQITIVDASLASQAIKQSVISYLSKKLLQGRVNKENNLGGDVIDHRLLFVIEEAHNYAGSNLAHSCKHQLQRVASEGRKFGIGLLIISQKPSKIDEEILSQCNTGIYMHITNPKDKDHIRRTFECINDTIISDLDSLDVGECIIAGAVLDIPFLLCNVDHIKIEKDSASKFSFERKQKPTLGGFDYA